jgi:tRNA-2-methylthio-N6-dimethylallyladenosine synthase
MERVRYAQSYVFKYSPRPGTVAAEELVDDVSDADKERRNQELLAVQERLCIERNRALVGAVQEVLVEGQSPRNPGRLQGRTAWHRIVHFDSTDVSLTGSYVPVRMQEAQPHCMIGTMLAHDAAQEGTRDRAEAHS